MTTVSPSKTLNLMDAQLVPFVQAMPPADLSDIAAVRNAILGQFESSGEHPFTVRLMEGRDDAPGVEIYIYNAGQPMAKRPAVLHIHGGGMVCGSAKMVSFSAPSIIQAIDAVVLSVEYRLAPETPFPGPQEDCYAALAWLFEHAEELGVDRESVIVMGESAGGGLAAAVALMARDRDEYHYKGQVLIFPMLDHRTGSGDDPWRNSTTGEFVWTREANQIGWKALQGDYKVDDERKGWFSPALAEDLSGLPATYIATGALDLFLDENLDYARRLIASGSRVDLSVYAGRASWFSVGGRNRPRDASRLRSSCSIATTGRAVMSRTRAGATQTLAGADRSGDWPVERFLARRQAPLFRWGQAGGAPVRTCEDGMSKPRNDGSALNRSYSDGLLMINASTALPRSERLVVDIIVGESVVHPWHDDASDFRPIRFRPTCQRMAAVCGSRRRAATRDDGNRHSKRHVSGKRAVFRLTMRTTAHWRRTCGLRSRRRRLADRRRIVSATWRVASYSRATESVSCSIRVRRSWR